MSTELGRAEKLRKLSTDWLDNFIKSGLDDFKPLVEPDAVYKVGHDVYHGPEGFAFVAKMARFLYPTGQERTYSGIMVDGNRVAMQITVTAVTNKGADYENYYAVHFLYNDEDRIVELTEYPDTAYCQEKFSYEGFEEYLKSN